MDRRRSALAQVIPQSLQGVGSIGPVHQLLTLVLGEGEPVIKLQLHAAEIQLAAHTERDATPIPDEILLK